MKPLELDFQNFTVDAVRAQRLLSGLRENGFLHDLQSISDHARKEETVRLRKVLQSACESLDREKDKKWKFQMDLEAGLSLYRLLPPKHITMRVAAHNGFWVWMACVVIPDLIEKRFEGSPPDDYFWKHTWRIWPKRSWWLIHRAWQGSEAKTRKVLASATTDWEVGLVERAGRQARSVEVTRSVLRALAGKKQVSEKDFRETMKFQTHFSDNIEASLLPGGYDELAKRVTRAVELLRSMRS